MRRVRTIGDAARAAGEGDRDGDRTPTWHASAALSTRMRAAWCGSSLLALGVDGWCGGPEWGSPSFEGWYFREARHLSHARLELFGEPPVLGSIAEGPHRMETSFLYPPVESRGGGGSGSGGSSVRHGVPARGLDLFASWRVRPASLELVVRLTARWQEEVAVETAWELGTDFADIQQAIGDDELASPGGFGADATATGDGVAFACRHPDLPLETRVAAGGGGAAWAWDGERLRATVRLSRQRPVELTLRAVAVDAADPLDEEGERRREERLAAWRRSLARVTAPGGDAFVHLTAAAMEDLGSLALLDGPEDEWLAPAAGVPYYPAFFARDALTAGWQATVLDRGELLEAAHAKACRLIGRQDDPWRDEQPGRIVQQARRGPLARLGDTPFDRYYGDYASPLMLVVSLGQLYIWTGDRAVLRRRWPQAMAALDWAERHGDLDGDGYLEYLTRSPLGPKHQGWKDSDNAVVDERGRQVEPPFAGAELQGYWFAALEIGAALALVLGKPWTAWRLARRAVRLKRRFDRDFWLDEEGIVAFGLDADKRPVRAPTSNAGHCLTTGIVDRRRVPRLVERLFAPDLFSGWGIRTLSSDNPSFNPLSYHLGSVWPVENATILLGLRRYGCDGAALRLAKALWELGRMWAGGRVPECVGGHPRGGPDGSGDGHPGAYPHANAPQAWNQSAWPLLVQSLLGLQPFAPLRTLGVAPLMPEWLPELEVQGLRVGAGEVDLHFRRDRRGRGRFRVAGRRGARVRVVRQPPLDDLAVGPLGRLAALLRRS